MPLSGLFRGNPFGGGGADGAHESFGALADEDGVRATVTTAPAKVGVDVQGASFSVDTETAGARCMVCDGGLPALAVAHADPCCSRRCARVWWGIPEPASERFHISPYAEEMTDAPGASSPVGRPEGARRRRGREPDRGRVVGMAAEVPDGLVSNPAGAFR